MKKIKIIKILSEHEVIINAGTREGITQGDQFKIKDPKKRVLEDIDTGEILDVFEGYKNYVTVKEVREKYSICKSPTYTTGGIASIATSVSLLGESLSQYNNLQKEKTVVEPLNVSKYDIDNIFSKYTSSIVEIGDEVVKF